MKFYIITPAWNALRWLPCAVRSVRDQACPSIEVHHHVQDGGSTDGSREWLETWQREHGNEPDYRFSFESAPDRGMYDAINRAWMAYKSVATGAAPADVASGASQTAQPAAAPADTEVTDAADNKEPEVQKGGQNE